MSESAISLDQFESLLQESKRSRFTEDASKFSTRTLVWLALPPFWQLPLAKQGFPISETEFITGGEVGDLLDSVVKARFADTESTGVIDDSVSCWMTPLQRQSLIEQITNGGLPTGSLTGLEYLQKETAEIGRHILKLQGKEELSSVLWRWASLAARSDSLHGLSEFFGEQIRNALQSARDAAQTAAPEALRWLEAFAPFVEIFGSFLEVALTGARREYEIFNRQAYDQRYLTSYLVRNEQDAALLDLLDQPDGDENAPWALHYVGAGGVGKTMLMRHINAHLSPEHNLAIARIDFDYLNPDYPAKQPGLLLLGFAVELSKYLGKSDGFLRFRKQILELHHGRQSVSETADFVDVRSGEWTYIIGAFVNECHALLEMSMRPLLILDTCEELVKLRPDGKLPPSVRVTFDILEEIHRLMPEVRVIFAGRRPLAGVGYDWRLRDNDFYVNKLPERDYLMLHVISGFDRDEATAFLSKYKRGQVPEEMFEAILTRSRNVIKESDRPYLFEDEESVAGDDIGPQTGEEIRYNPFDLDLYADWTVSEPDLDEKKLIAGAHFYVKERIVGRVNSQLKKLLPALLLLGRFDEALLRELYGKDKDDFSLLFEELITQEWIDSERSVSVFDPVAGTSNIVDAPENSSLSVWAIDQNMRERLLSYYRAEKFSELSNARKDVAPLLLKITLERDWQDLSISYFEAAAQVLTELNTELAADWWEKIEAKLADTTRWDWAYALTSQLLATGGVAELKERGNPRAVDGGLIGNEAENILRPLILATYAAALTHIKPRDIKDVWREVKEKAHHHPTEAGRYWLSKRAAFGLLAADIADSKKVRTVGTLEKRVDEFKQELLSYRIPEADTFRASQLQASIIAVFEKITECCEFLEEEFLERVNLNLIDLDVGWWTKNLPDKLSIFYQILRLRLIQFGSYSYGANLILPGEKLDYGQKWLDWRAPDDPVCRQRLELLRRPDPNSERLEDRLFAFGDRPAVLDTIDAERLESAILTLKWHEGSSTDLDIDEEKIEASLSLAKKISADSQSFNEAFFVNAHRAFPPYFIAALEIRAMSGDLSATVHRALSISEEAERGNNHFIRRETDRLLARLAFHFRLRDERGVGFGAGLRTSEELEDIKLSSMLGLLDGRNSDDKYWHDLISKADKRKYAALLHFRYRSSPRLLIPRKIEKIRGKNKEDDGTEFELTSQALRIGGSTFESLIAFDDVEYDLRKTTKTFLPNSRFADLNELPHRDFAFKALLASVNIETTLKGIGGFETLNFNDGQSEKHPSEESIKLVGRRRAAAIMLEEGTLLAIRYPKAAMPLLVQASDLYRDCEDTCGQFLTNLTRALLAIKIKEMSHLKMAFGNLKHTYNELIKDESGLPTWEDLALCVDSAVKEGDPAKIIADFFDEYADNLYWRPILARLIYCLVREREFDDDGSLTLVIKAWLRVNYARATGGDAPVFPPEFVFWKQNQDGSKQETSYWNHAGTYLFYVFAAALISGYFYLISSEPILILTSLILIGFVYMVLWVRRFKLEIFLSATKVPANLNLPLSVPHEIKWRSNVVLQWLFDPVFKETTPIDQSSENSYSSLPAILNRSLQRFLKALKLRITPLPTALLFESANSVGAPWEAAFGSSPKDFRRTRFMFRRILQKAYAPRTDFMFPPIGICYWAADNALLDSVYKGWSSLTHLKNFHHTGFILSNIKKGQSNKNVCILHLVGLPIETPYGMRLEIVSSETDAQNELNPTDVSDIRNERIASVDRINQEFPNLRVCVVQLPPRLEEPRSLTNRTEIAKLRRFCADVFQSGIGAVILLPAVNSELSVGCQEILAKFVMQTDKEQTWTEGNLVSLQKSKNAIDEWIPTLAWLLLCLPVPVLFLLPLLLVVRFIAIPFVEPFIKKKRSTSPKRWMRAVYDIQQLIAEKGHSNEEAASEMAFDVCLYLHDEFTWRFHK